MDAQFCHFVPAILIQFPDSHIRDKMDCRWNQGRSHTFRIDEAQSVITKGAILGGKGLGGREVGDMPPENFEINKL